MYHFSSVCVCGGGVRVCVCVCLPSVLFCAKLGQSELGEMNAGSGVWVCQRGSSQEWTDSYY